VHGVHENGRAGPRPDPSAVNAMAWKNQCMNAGHVDHRKFKIAVE
jgi:hypothetical protein